MIRSAVIGTKKMGKNFLRVLRDSSDYELVGYLPIEGEFYDPKNQFGIAFSNLESLIEQKIELVFITSPPEFHFSHIEWCLKRNIKVFTEKPIALNATHAQQLIDLAKKNNCFFAVGHIENFNPVVRKLKSIIDSGLIGRLIHLNAIRVGGYPQTIQEGNNVLLDLALHDIDILTLLCGPLKFAGGIAHSTHRQDAIDTAEILLATEDDLISASVHVNWITPTKIRQLRATGSHGVCTIDYILQTCEVSGGNLSSRGNEPELDYAQIQSSYTHPDHIDFGILNEEPLIVEIRELAQAFQQNKYGLFCPEKALSSLKLTVEAIEKCNPVGRAF